MSGYLCLFFGSGTLFTFLFGYNRKKWKSGIVELEIYVHWPEFLSNGCDAYY